MEGIEDWSNRYLSVEQKLHLVDLVEGQAKSCSKVARMYNLSQSTVSKYVRAHRKQTPLFESKGRPSKLDDIATTEILQIVKRKTTRSQASAAVVPVDELIQIKVAETQKRRHPAGEDVTISPYCQKSIKRFKMEHQID